jgi:coiled-coil domain-containing protein 61
VEYLVRVNTIQISTFDPQNCKLIIDAEEKLSGNIWRGDYTLKYIEEITKKTGSFKKFAVFVKMLISALK